MSGELFRIIENIEREKGIEREVLFAAIESALVSASRKTYGQSEEVDIQIDRSTGAIKILRDGKEVKQGQFGRIAAQTAKQVIIQKIREAERESIFGEYEKRVGELVSGTVHRNERRTIIVDLGRTEGVIPPQEQSTRERYNQGDRVRAYVLEVKMTNRGPQIVLSRTSPLLVKELFELEVPEIHEGIVEIKAVSREAGDRTKIAVLSKDEKVDAVGACVGIRGQRVKNVVRELRGEKIDIVRFSDDVETFVTNALSPAQIGEIKIDRDARKVSVSVKDEFLSVAIGKKGQNVRLASRLVGWQIDVHPVRPKVDIEITGLDGVGPKMAKILQEAGFKDVVKLAEASAEALAKVKGVGPKTAEKISKSAKQALEEATHKARADLFDAAVKKASREEEARKKEEAVEEVSDEPAKKASVKTSSEESAPQEKEEG